MRAKTLIFTIFICLSSIASYSQNSADLALATNLLSPAPKVTYPVEYGNESELKKGAKLMFTFYKRYISSQDVQSCNFSPSCSVYAMHAIEKKGMFSGFFLTFDRLTRCHPLGANYYPKDPETGLWLDPVTP